MLGWLLGSFLVAVAVALAGYKRHSTARRLAAFTVYQQATCRLDGLGRPHTESDAVRKAADMFQEKYGWARGRAALKESIRRNMTMDCDRPFKECAPAHPR